MAGINQGLASDRLLVDRDLGSPLATALAQGVPVPALDAEPLALLLPLYMGALAAAADLRLSLRMAMQAAFAKGRRIEGFDPKARVYLLST